MIHAIDHALQSAGVTRSELAERLGVRPPLVTNYLNGKKEPGLTALAGLAQALGKRWALVDA